MNALEMSAYVDGAREMVFMLMDEHGILCEDGHWMTDDELFSLPEAAVIKLFNQIYGRG